MVRCLPQVCLPLNVIQPFRIRKTLASFPIGGMEGRRADINSDIENAVCWDVMLHSNKYQNEDAACGKDISQSKLPRNSHCLASATDSSAWHLQLWQIKRQSCQNDPRSLWHTVNSIISVSMPTNQRIFSADDFADYFHSKIEAIQNFTSTASPPVTEHRDISQSLLNLESVTTDEMKIIFWERAAKTCPRWSHPNLVD